MNLNSTFNTNCLITISSLVLRICIGEIDPRKGEERGGICQEDNEWLQWRPWKYRFPHSMMSEGGKWEFTDSERKKSNFLINIYCLLFKRKNFLSTKINSSLNLVTFVNLFCGARNLVLRFFWKIQYNFLYAITNCLWIICLLQFNTIKNMFLNERLEWDLGKNHFIMQQMFCLSPFWSLSGRLTRLRKKCEKKTAVVTFFVRQIHSDNYSLSNGLETYMHVRSTVWLSIFIFQYIF